MGDHPKIEKQVQEILAGANNPPPAIHPRLLKEIPPEVIDDTHSVRITADGFELTPVNAEPMPPEMAACLQQPNQTARLDCLFSPSTYQTPDVDTCLAMPDPNASVNCLFGPGLSLFTPTSTSATTIATPVAPTEEASEVDKALHELATADTDEKRKFAAKKALAAAKKSPNAEVLAVPMVTAEIAAINGKYLEAAKQYAQLSASLQVLAATNKEIQPHVDTVEKRRRGVLAAGAAVAVAQIKYAESPEAGLRLQKQATDCADQLYLAEPTEKNLQLLLATYAQVGLDVREGRRRMAANDYRINALTLGTFDPKLDPTGESNPAPDNDPFNSKSILGPDINDIDHFGFKAERSKADTIAELQQTNKELKGIVDETEQHILSLIARAHPNDPFASNVQTATAHVVMGNNPAAMKNLQVARTLFKDKSVEHTPDNKVTYITLLHRMVDIAGTKTALKEEVLLEARQAIDEMIKSHPKVALTLRLENMELLGQVRVDKAARKLNDKSLSDDDRKKAVDNYHRALSRKHENILMYCKQVLPMTQDPEARKVLIGGIARADAGLLEAQLDRSMTIYLNGNEDLGKGYAQVDMDSFHRRMAELQQQNPTVDLSEALSRGMLAQAHFQFRTGQIEESVKNLRKIVNDHPKSTAANMVRSKGGWAHKYSIVTDKGEFNPNIGTESWTAGTKELLGKLNKKPGRAMLAATGGSIVGWGAGMIFAPEITGPLLIAGAVGGFLIDRTVLVAQEWSQISAAYNTGISTVSTEEAAREGGIFALQLFSMFVGGAAGGVAERAVLAGGTRLARSMAMRGITSSPWMRATGAFALREASYVANAYAFHETSNLTTQAIGTAVGLDIPQPDSSHNDDVISSWLFVRGFAKAMKMNLGAKFVPGESFGAKLAQGSINMGVGLGIVHTAKALREWDLRHLDPDTLARSAFDLLLMHHGNKALGSVIPMSGIEKMSKDLETMTKKNMRDAAAAVKFKQDTGLSLRQAVGLGSNPLAALLPVLMYGLPIVPGKGTSSRKAESKPEKKADPEATNPGHTEARNPGAREDTRTKAGRGTNPGVDTRKVANLDPTSFLAEQLRKNASTDSDQSKDTRSEEHLYVAAFIEYYNQPARIETLKALGQREGDVGRSARRFHDTLMDLHIDIAEYNRLAAENVDKKDPAVTEKMEKLWKHKILRMVNPRKNTRLGHDGNKFGAGELEQHDYNQIETAYANKQQALNSDLRGLFTVLAILEVKANAEANNSGKMPEMGYKVSYQRPEDLAHVNFDLNNLSESFSKLSAHELVQLNIRASSHEAAQRIVETFRNAGYEVVSHPGQKINYKVKVPYTHKIGGVEIQGTHTVGLRLAVEPAPLGAKTRLSPAETASHGFELAWNNKNFWSETAIPVLHNGKVIIFKMRPGLPEPTGKFTTLASEINETITDPVAKERLLNMVTALHGLHERLPQGANKTKIETAIDESRTALLKNGARTESLAAVWLTLGTALAASAPKLPHVARHSTEMRVDLHLPKTDYDHHVAQNSWKYTLPVLQRMPKRVRQYIELATAPYYVDGMSEPIVPDAQKTIDLVTHIGVEKFDSILKAVKNNEPARANIDTLLNYALDTTNSERNAHVKDFINKASIHQILLLVTYPGKKNVVAQIAEKGYVDILSGDPATHVPRIEKMTDTALRDVLLALTAQRMFQQHKDNPKATTPEGMALLLNFGIEPDTHFRFPWNAVDVIDRSKLYFRIKTERRAFRKQLGKAIEGKETELDALTDKIWELILIQDYKDTHLPYTPHGWKHTLDVVKEQRKIYNGSPELQKALIGQFGSEAKALAVLDIVAMMHDVGYGALKPGESKGIHAIRSGELWKAQIADHAKKTLDLNDKQIEDIFLAIQRHGADKKGKGGYMEANLDNPLLFVIRLADNLDSSKSRLRNIQTHPLFIEGMKEMREFANENPDVVNNKKEMKAALQKIRLSYERKFETNMNPNDAKLAKELLDRMDHLSWPHFKGCEKVSTVHITEKEGQMVVTFEIAGLANSGTVTEQLSGKTMEVDAALYQLWRAIVSAESLDYNGQKIKFKYVELHPSNPHNGDVTEFAGDGPKSYRLPLGEIQ